MLVTPYALIAGYMVFCTLIFGVVYVLYKDTPPHPSRLQATAQEEKSKVPTWIKLTIILTMALFLHLHCGLVIAYGQLLTTYGVNCDLKLDKQTGALMSSLFWGTFTFFRLFAIFFVDIIGAEKNIIFNLVLCSVSCIFLVPFGNSSVWCLWVGIALMGLGTSSIWASVYGYLEQFFPMHSKIAATFTVSACLGEFVLPTIVGNFIDVYPVMFLWITLFCTVADVLLFAFVNYLCHKYYDQTSEVLLAIETNEANILDCESASDKKFNLNLKAAIERKENELNSVC